MTLVIELEQYFESVAQVDRRAHSSWSSLSNEWRLRKIEARKQVDVEERGALRRRWRALQRRHLDAKIVRCIQLLEGLECRALPRGPTATR